MAAARFVSSFSLRALLRASGRQMSHQAVTQPSKNFLGIHSSRLTRHFSLLSQVENELGYEKEAGAPSPMVTGFNVDTKGTLATLTKKYKNEEITVELDANNSADMSDDMDNMGEEEEDNMKAPVFLPTFTVKITKPNGTCMSLDCTFEENYNEVEDNDDGSLDWDNLVVHNITVVPNKGNETANHLYTADTSFLGDAMMDGIYSYLEERGLDRKFSEELLAFFRNHERKCYVKFLEDLRTFVKS